MHRGRALVPIIALSIVAGCHSTPAQTDEPALLPPTDDAGRAEIIAVLREALGLEQLRLAEDFLQTSSVLLIERSVRGNLQDRNPLGRNLDMPERFTLVLGDDGCALIRQRTQQRWVLRRTQCVARPR